jgi:hypothetical protein
MACCCAVGGGRAGAGAVGGGRAGAVGGGRAGAVGGGRAGAVGGGRAGAVAAAVAGGGSGRYAQRIITSRGIGRDEAGCTCPDAVGVATRKVFTIAPFGSAHVNHLFEEDGGGDLP